MAVDHVKSLGITNLDTVPPVQNTTGEYGSGHLISVEGNAVVLASGSVDATYQMVRIPTNAKVKSVNFESAAQGAGKFDIGVYYASDGLYGHASSLLAAAAVSQALFASAVDCASAVARTDVTNESGTYTAEKRIQPLWQAAGLTADPGGYFDIVATVVTTAVTTGTGRIGLSLTYVM